MRSTCQITIGPKQHPRLSTLWIDAQPRNGAHELTPHEVYVGKKPTLSHLQVFESIAYVHIPTEKWQKLNPSSKKCIFVGYSSKKKGYKCFNTSTRSVRVSRDVIFDELASWYKPDLAPSKPTEECWVVNSDADIRQNTLPKDNPSSIELSEPHGPSRDQRTSKSKIGQRQR